MTDEREAVETAQHTPGPWGCVRYGGPEEFEIQADHRKLAIVNSRQRVEERGVVRFEPGPFSEAEALANARLIAAAPALLEVVERAIASLGYDHDNKIDGGVYCYVCQTHGETSATLPHKESCLKRQMREAVRAARGEE